MLISRRGSKLIQDDKHNDDDVSRTLTIPPIKCQPTTKPWLTGWTGWISVKFLKFPPQSSPPPLIENFSSTRILYNLIRDDYNTKDTVSPHLHHNPELCIIHPSHPCCRGGAGVCEWFIRQQERTHFFVLTRTLIGRCGTGGVSLGRINFHKSHWRPT